MAPVSIPPNFVKLAADIVPELDPEDACIFEPSIAADELISAFTIVLFSILVLFTAPSFISVVLICWDCAS